MLLQEEAEVTGQEEVDWAGWAAAGWAEEGWEAAAAAAGSEEEAGEAAGRAAAGCSLREAQAE